MPGSDPPPQYQLQLGAGMWGCIILWGVLALGAALVLVVDRFHG